MPAPWFTANILQEKELEYLREEADTKAGTEKVRNKSARSCIKKQQGGQSMMETSKRHGSQREGLPLVKCRRIRSSR